MIKIYKKEKVPKCRGTYHILDKKKSKNGVLLEVCKICGIEIEIENIK